MKFNALRPPGGLTGPLCVSLLKVKHTVTPKARAELAAALPSTTQILRGSWLHRRIRHRTGCAVCARGPGHPVWVLTVSYPGGRTQQISLSAEQKTALSENLTERPFLRNFLHPLNREEPTLVTAIRLAGDERHRGGWFERDAEGAGLRLNWAGHGERLDEGVGIPGISGPSAGDRRRAQAAQVVDQAQAGESQHDLCGLRKTGAQDARGV